MRPDLRPCVRPAARARAFFSFSLFEKKEMRETPASFARRLGVHKATVTRAIQSGRLTRGDDGLLDVDDSLRSWEATKAGTRPDVAARHQRARSPASATANHAQARAPQNASSAPPQAPQATPAAAHDPAEGQEQVHDHADQPAPMPGRQQHYAAIRIGAQNNLIKLGIALRTHRRYPLASIRAEALALGGVLRASLDRLVDQTAPRLALLTTTEQRQALLAAEANSLRRALRRELPRALRRLRDTGKDKP